MVNLIAYCGINCATCPLYKATLNNDITKKQELAIKWGQLYNRSIDIRDMECCGCKTKKRFSLSDKCDIAYCNISRDIDTCTQCSLHSCDRIKQFYKWQKDNDTKVERN